MITKEQLKRRLQNQEKIRQLSESNKRNPMPSLPKMVKNATGSVIKNVKSVIHGNNLNVSEDEKEKRLNICRACPYFEKTQERCSQCGCFLSVKTYLKAERCPLSRW